MSEQNVLAFLNKTNSDKGLASKVKALSTRNLSDLIGLAQSEGFAFSADEWQAVSATAFGGELDDAALDQVTGGADSASPQGSPYLQCDENPVFSNQSLFKSFGK